MDSTAMTTDRVVDTALFERVLDKTFAKIDSDNSGELHRDEVAIALCHVHFSLAKHCPGVTEPPTARAVSEFMREYDADSSGSLSRKEFGDLARKWLAQQGGAFVGRAVLAAALSMVVLPGLAAGLHQRLPVPAKNRVPETLFKIAFGVALKLAMSFMRT